MVERTPQRGELAQLGMGDRNRRNSGAGFESAQFTVRS
jgi:hypothetical protein